MCWCTPGLRTPNCGKVKCVPPNHVSIEMCFLVGIYPDKDGDQWEVQGIYDNKKDAEKACLNRYWFVMPVRKNYALPLESEEVGYYPNNSEPK